MRNGCQKDPMEVIGRAKGFSHKEIIQNLSRHNNYYPYHINQIKRYRK
ncbi:MAG: hypothetical protein ACFFAV_08005 [Candidatus Hermodarchaeota archaeon]